MKRQNQNQIRQGDVYMERVSSIPTTAKQITPIGGRIILAEGEATGHHHSVDADAADWWKTDTEQFLQVYETAEVVHQEHAPLILKKGIYHITRQREYTPAATRNVMD